MTIQNTTSSVTQKPWLAIAGYLAVALLIAFGWSIHDLRLVVASEGLGYMLGVVGSVMMVLLLTYPLRKRARFLRNAGSISHWFRVHMILGIVGPVLVLFHSNFTLGSVNSRVALFCTIVVSSSGILGRYLYAKIHRGLYGQRVTFDNVRTEIEQSRTSKSALGSIMPLINKSLNALEDKVNDTPDNLIASILLALGVSLKLIPLRFKLRRQIRKEIERLAIDSAVIHDNKKRLLRSTYEYLRYRLTVLRRFAQLQACERLFSLWHVVHYPLFMVLVVAAIVHVIAVHMY